MAVDPQKGGWSVVENGRRDSQEKPRGGSLEKKKKKSSGDFG
jgi:hypothetical protein